MALSSTIFKVDIDLSNFNSQYYENFNLTMAKHPSEHEERMMFRLLAFLYCAHPDLQFTKGLSTTEEPELWQKDYSGDILQWIELGLPDVKRIRQASGKSRSVKVFTYQPNQAHQWYQSNKSDLAKITKLEVYHLNIVENGPLDKIVSKSMKLGCIIEDQLMYLSNDDERVTIKVESLKSLD
tara:strand:- start:1509 stop:2054 length:546 start_codon:yes stop_codon:yes gene_type:complete